MSWKATHNGYNTECFQTEKDCYDYIDKCLNEYKNLKPEKIFQHTENDKTVIVYRCKTLYCEMFLIEKPNMEIDWKDLKYLL